MKKFLSLGLALSLISGTVSLNTVVATESAIISETATKSITIDGVDFEIVDDGVLAAEKYLVKSETFNFDFVKSSDDEYILIVYGTKDSTLEFLSERVMALDWSPEGISGPWSGEMNVFEEESDWHPRLKMYTFYENEMPYAYISFQPYQTLEEANEHYGFDITPYIYPNGVPATNSITLENGVELEIVEDGVLADGEYFVTSDTMKFAFETNSYGNYELVMYGDKDAKYTSHTLPNIDEVVMTWQPEGVTSAWGGRKFSYFINADDGNMSTLSVLSLIEGELPYEVSIGQYQTLEEANEHYGFDITPYIYPNGFTKGEVNGDGIIDSSDSSKILEMYASISSGKIVQSDLMGLVESYDVNVDGIIDSYDSSLILSYYAYKSSNGDLTLDEFLNKI